MFLRFLDSILPGSGAIIKATIRAVERGVASFVESFRNDWIRYTQTESSESRPSEDVRHDIHETDGEISDLERKLRRDGELSQHDEEKLQQLRKQASDLAEEHQQSRSQETTNEILSDPNNAAATSLSQDFIHVLDWSRGPVVRQKRCPRCGSAMYLNRKNQSQGAIFSTADYFWACINYYKPEPLKCKGGRNFAEQDFGLLHKSGITELEMTAEDFYTITGNKDIQSIIDRKVRSVAGAQDIDVVCPIHGLPMVPRERKNIEVVLDRWIEECPHPGCGQTRKLKDFAQLAALLRRITGEGMLG